MKTIKIIGLIIGIIAILIMVYFVFFHKGKPMNTTTETPAVQPLFPGTPANLNITVPTEIKEAPGLTFVNR